MTNQQLAVRATGVLPNQDAAARAINLTKIYGQGETQVVACDHINVEFPRGQFAAIMGPSGSGKSTLMHCLAGLDTPTDGQVWVGGTAITGLTARALTKLRREHIGFIFQSFNLVPTLTAAENIVLPLAIAGRKPDQTWYRTVIEALGLGARLGHRPSQLSGGQQQRVACARSLVARPDIIFADEPTGNLDSGAAAELLGFLREAVDQFGQTIVMVTHDPTSAAYGDRALFLVDGRIVTDLPAPTQESVLAQMTTLNKGH